VIQAWGLGKRYQITESRQRYGVLRESLEGAVKSWFKPRSSRLPSGEAIWALRDVSFELQEGEVLGIIGRNGAGKSTLLKILARITEPTEGKAEVRGRIGSLLEVGTGFHPELTGRENVFLSGAILGMTKAEIIRRFDDIVAFAGIEPFLDTPIKHYSSGMYMRLAFAVAAHLDPDILVVDEVLSVGDAEFQRKCLGRMEQLSSSGRTVLFVSHNLGAIASLCSRCLLLDHGTPLALGPTPAVIAAYQQTFSGPGSATVELPSRPDLPAQIVAAWLEDESGRAIACTRIGGHIDLCIRYSIHEPVFDAGVGFLLSRDEVPILYSHDADGNPELSRARSVGTFVTKASLPTDLLTPGRYDIALHISDATTDWSEPGACISFTIDGYISDTPLIAIPISVRHSLSEHP